VYKGCTTGYTSLGVKEVYNGGYASLVCRERCTTVGYASLGMWENVYNGGVCLPGYERMVYNGGYASLGYERESCGEESLPG